MDHLNYFHPYSSKDAKHEDNLTRAYLVVLKHSNTALMIFYDLAIKNCIELRTKKKLNFQLPFYSELSFSKVEFYTQKTEVADIVGSTVLSVLLTDDHIKVNDKIKSSSRGARYDGIVNIGDVTLLIENKPRSYNVWEEQLSPNLKNLAKTVDLIPLPAVVTWSDIIKSLNLLLSSNNVDPSERIIISDFLDYVDANFGFLNPFDNLKLCKGNKELIVRRIKNILVELVKDENDTGYHQGWQTYYIKTGFEEVKLIGIEYFDDNKESPYLRISFYFGDTMNQAKHFYKKLISYLKIEELKNKGWNSEPHFHLSHMNLNLIWFKTDIKKEKYYYRYWLNNLKEIYQIAKDDLLNYLKLLDEKSLIILNKVKMNDVQQKILDTNRSKINICPGFHLYYQFELNKAEILDSKGEMVLFMKKKILEALSILNYKIKFLK